MAVRLVQYLRPNGDRKVWVVGEAPAEVEKMAEQLDQAGVELSIEVLDAHAPVVVSFEAWDPSREDCLACELAGPGDNRDAAACTMVRAAFEAAREMGLVP